MKLNIKNKKVIIFCSLIFIIAIIVGIYFYKRNDSAVNDTIRENAYTDIRNDSAINDTIRENAYIDIWRDNSMDTADIALYSKGSGADEKLYLGESAVHYIVDRNGKVHTYQHGSFQNIATGEMDPPTVEYIKTLSQSELESLENDLKSIIETNSSNDRDWNSIYWYIEIDGNSTRVNVNVKNEVLNNYL